MSDAAAVMAIVLFLFFLTGVAAGVVVVIAASARRADQAYRRNRPIDDGPPYPFEGELDDDGPDRPPRWPTRGGR